jgi:hypothetical protein
LDTEYDFFFFAGAAPFAAGFFAGAAIVLFSVDYFVNV